MDAPVAETAGMKTDAPLSASPATATVLRNNPHPHHPSRPDAAGSSPADLRPTPASSPVERPVGVVAATGCERSCPYCHAGLAHPPDQDLPRRSVEKSKHRHDGRPPPDNSNRRRILPRGGLHPPIENRRPAMDGPATPIETVAARSGWRIASGCRPMRRRSSGWSHQPQMTLLPPPASSGIGAAARVTALGSHPVSAKMAAG